jgi:hypothetical protein
MLTAIALYAGVSCAGADTGAGSGMWPEEIIDTMDDKRLVLFLPNEDIAASPQWLPAEGTPPLNIAEAMAHLKKWMTDAPRYRKAEIHEIELKPIRHHEQEHRWYYLFQLRHPGGGQSKAIYAAVLLNGKVVPAIVEPSSIK